MAKHVQRKRFDDPEFAKEAAEAFNELHWRIPRVHVTAEAFEIDGEYWVCLTQQREIVTTEELLLPDYG